MGTVCELHRALYNIKTKTFDIGEVVVLDENKQVLPSELEKRWRFTLIETPNDMVHTKNVETAHLIWIKGCYLVWEEMR